MLKQERLDGLLARFEALESEMSSAPDPDQFVKLSKEYADLSPVVAVVRDLKACREEEDGLHEILQDPDADDEMKKLAIEEASQITPRIEKLDKKISVLLLPKDAADEKSAILEVRAGTGGR